MSVSDLLQQLVLRDARLHNFLRYLLRRPLIFRPRLQPFARIAF